MHAVLKVSTEIMCECQNFSFIQVQPESISENIILQRKGHSPDRTLLHNLHILTYYKFYIIKYKIKQHII
jgi:hypothetical protein